jgi:hypothetical protein
MFFVSLMNAATVVYDGDVGPSSEALLASYDAALQALAQNVDTQPLPVDLSAELTKQIEAAGLTNYASGLLSQIAEMQKQLEALNLLPPPSQGTVIAVTGTAPVVSTGGISPNISMAAANTSTDGYLTSTDWNTFNNKAPATSGTSILYGNGSGGFSNVSTGSGVSFVAGVLSATGSGGTITSVTATAPIASSGGFTPNISINAAYGDTVNPYAAKTANYVLAGPTSGAAAVPAFRALVAADIPSLSYVTSVSGTSPVVSSGGTTPAISMPAATTSVNGYLTSTDWNTFNNKGSGTVTSVTGTSPVVSSGGATPAISMAAATTSVNGYLTSTDWTTFNGKQAALVSGTNIKTVNGTSLLGSGDVGTITYAYGGTGQTTVTTGDLLYGSAANTWSKLADVATGNALISGGVGVAPSYGKIGLTTHVSGTLPTANGGTNLTSFTANGVVYASSTSALATGSAFVFDGTNVGIGTATTSNGNLTIQQASATTGGPVLSLWNSNAAAGNTCGYLKFYSNTTVRAQIRSVVDAGGPYYGNLIFSVGENTLSDRMTLASNGIVTMSAYGAGTATFSAAGVISSVSDETWKIKDGVPVDTDAMLKKLEPGYWYYNEEKQEIFGKNRQLGFYAQNVNAAIGPEAALEPEEGKPWGYYDRSVLAVVVMSLQKALDTIESLETRLAALEQK